MKHLIFLSDLWGERQSDWWSNYLIPLREHFNVRCYDSCELAGIDLQLYTQDALHQQFVNGGIDRAVAQLLELEASQPPAVILAFSIGGTIAWRSIMAGLPCYCFYAVSATRLRKETELFACSGNLIYGEEDTYRPNDDWLGRQTSLTTEILPGEGHDVYRLPDMASRVVGSILGPSSRGRKA